MPFPADDDAAVITLPAAAPLHDGRNWRAGLPVLTGQLVTLRELEMCDAPSLFASLTTEAVARFISPPPATVEGFEKFIAWTHRQRVEGLYICFAIVPRGSDAAVGLFRVHTLATDFRTAEWGFALASEHWGSGMFPEAAQLTLKFAFDVVGVRRLEARAALANGRGNGALQKIGAKQEAVLRAAFMRHGELFDQALWTILESEWRTMQAKFVWTS